MLCAQQRMNFLRSSLTAAVFAAMANLAPLTAAPPDGWQLVFSDEFDGDTLDTAKWSTTMDFVGTHGPRYHNEFYLSYTTDDDVIVRDGELHLLTEHRTVEGEEAPGVFDYTQGLVSSHGKFAFTHGYIEIRAKYPGGKGLWPCFWLMPQQRTWPPEFDIAEYYGGQRKMHHGLAYGTMTNTLWDSSGDHETDFVDNWHTYALEWSPGRAVWFVDDVPRKTIVADYVPSGAMYIVLSNSISSIHGPSGAPDEITVFPNAFAIDYVRVWQKPQSSPVVASEPVALDSVRLNVPLIPESVEQDPAP